MSRVTANDAIGLHLPSAALGVVIAWGVVPMHAIGEDPATTAAVDRKAIVLQQELQDVLDTLTRDREALRKRTVSTFELAEKRIGLLKLSSDDEVKLLEILRQEKARFEAHELLPFSAPMWTTTLSYLKARQEIDRKAEVAYARLLLKYERQEEPERVAAVKRTRDEMLNPSVVARWRHRTGGNPEGTVTCLSNGCIGSPDSTNKWT
ncbi:MAG: hypothetical protein KDA75_22720, partial [Planctomycetaceae bacterium]|nr:hypothetical protein [Planctomycetaceae bacterium]